ncbi:MAG: DUF4393 domain-containing protein [Bauldia sp.]|nr:DUF4393 domain-containing protein [Bauldia sp.]
MKKPVPGISRSKTKSSKKTSERRPQTPISLSASAGVEASARYVRERKTTEVIPPDVTRAKSRAWLDLISPITEWAGLKGDKLRHKRDLLRLQREDTLTQIVSRAMEQVGGSPTRPVPVKFLVPFLEQASLEEPDSALVELWANLLATAAEEYDPRHVHFSSIMSQISSNQASAFRTLLFVTSERDLEFARDAVTQDYLPQRIQRFLVESLRGREANVSIDSFLSAVEAVFNIHGIEVVYISVNEGDASYESDLWYSNYSDSTEADYEILEAVGLVRRVEAEVSIGRFELYGAYYAMTALGYHFAKACKVFVSESV